MKTLHEWPKAMIRNYVAKNKEDAERIAQLFESLAAAQRRHWLDMAHPLPKRKGAKQ